VIFISKDTKDTALAASCVQDSKTGDIVVKLVNAGSSTKTMKINLARFKGIALNAELTELKGTADAVNSFENSQTVMPVKSTFEVSRSFEYSTPPMSLTVIRVKTKK
jgi:alpha-N-arabinofuranosidase